MKALKISYDEGKDAVELIDGQVAENWVDVCERFDNDVHRIRNADEHSPYTALYVCYDDENIPSHYLVEEDRRLDHMRHKVFLNKLGRTS